MPVIGGLALLALLWLAAATVVVSLCVMAARADREQRHQTFPRLATWRTVRTSSLRSAQSDQPAT